MIKDTHYSTDTATLYVFTEHMIRVEYMGRDGHGHTAWPATYADAVKLYNQYA